MQSTTVTKYSKRAGGYKATPFKQPRAASVVQRTTTVSAARGMGNVIPGTQARRAAYARGARRGLRLEPKTVDTTISMVFDNNSAVATTMKLLNTIPTGSSAITRIGKRVNLKAVAIRGVIQAASATTIDSITMLLVYVRNNNQAATLPAWTEVLVSQSSTALTNRDNASKFKILRRWDWNVTGNSTTPSTGNEVIHVEEFVNLKLKPSTWTNASTAGTIAEFEEGSLLLMTVGDGANAATTTPTFDGFSRCYFVDA